MASCTRSYSYNMIHIYTVHMQLESQVALGTADVPWPRMVFWMPCWNLQMSDDTWRAEGMWHACLVKIRTSVCRFTRDHKGRVASPAGFYLLRTELGVGFESQVVDTQLHSESEHISSPNLVSTCLHGHSSPISYKCRNLAHLALNTLHASSMSQHFDPCSTFLRWRA